MYIVDLAKTPSEICQKKKLMTAKVKRSDFTIARGEEVNDCSKPRRPLSDDLRGKSSRL
jgi:hypothetical protein